MPRCLSMHKVPPTARFCAICGARVLPDWVWMCLGALLLALIFAMRQGTVVRQGTAGLFEPPGTPIVVEGPPVYQTVIITATEPPPTPTHPSPTATTVLADQRVLSPTSTRLPTRTRMPTYTRTPRVAPTSTASPTPTRLPTRTRMPTYTRTPTVAPTPTASPTPTATLFPRAALLSFHGRYVIAMGEADDWILRQATRKDDPCTWFTLVPQADGRIALITCQGRYVTAPRTGATRADWLLRQEPVLGDCGKFTVLDLGDGRVAWITCAGKYWTAGDGGWEGSLQWTLVAETQEQLDWEVFKLEAQ